MSLAEPKPLSQEMPAEYAHRIGQWYFAWNKADKALGQFMTPLPVARFMARLLSVPSKAEPVYVLDPGAGFGILACAVCEVLTGDVVLDVYEVDHAIADYLDVCLAYARDWMQSHQRRLIYTVHRGDFILEYAASATASAFDVVISNPPYFKLNKADVRAQAMQHVVHGQPNIYALFMAASAHLLRYGGQAVFITPRSYASGVYFSRFREVFFSQMQPRALHLFESRRDVFDNVLQESLILFAARSTEQTTVTLSISRGYDFQHLKQRAKAIHDLFDEDGILHLPLSDNEDVMLDVVRLWQGSLHAYGMEVSTGPVVAFRAAHLICERGDLATTHAPLLWMQNIKAMQVDYPVRHKWQYLALTGADKLLLPNRNYVLLRRFSTKEEARRVTAAPSSRTFMATGSASKIISTISIALMGSYPKMKHAGWQHCSTAG